MDLEKHVIKAIDDYEQGNLESALMHACIAIDATAKKLNKGRGGRTAYKNCLRNYYWIIEPMLGGGINLEDTTWANLHITNNDNKPIKNPDLADVIYHIFRCSHTHGEAVSKNYDLLESYDGLSHWSFSHNRLHIPDRIIWALLGVAVFSKANKNIKTQGDYYLNWGSNRLGIGLTEFLLREWWGREEDFKKFLSQQNIIRVKLELSSLAPD